MVLSLHATRPGDAAGGSDDSPRVNTGASRPKPGLSPHGQNVLCRVEVTVDDQPTRDT